MSQASDSGPRILGAIAVAVALCLGVGGMMMWWSGGFYEIETVTRARVTRARSEMRSLAIALESYRADHGAFPAWSADAESSAFGEYIQQDGRYAGLPTFRLADPRGGGPETLTTPVSYIALDIFDPFSTARGAGFCYWSPPGGGAGEDAPEGWILWSRGPDWEFDITLENVAALYDPAGRVPSEALIGVSYDPTNGSDSGGDVWRVKR